VAGVALEITQRWTQMGKQRVAFLLVLVSTLNEIIHQLPDDHNMPSRAPGVTIHSALLCSLPWQRDTGKCPSGFFVPTLKDEAVPPGIEAMDVQFPTIFTTM